MNDTKPQIIELIVIIISIIVLSIGIKFYTENRNLKAFLDAKIYIGDYVVTKKPERKYEVKGLRYTIGHKKINAGQRIPTKILNRGFTKYYIIEKNGKDLEITTEDMNLKKTFEIVGIGSE